MRKTPLIAAALLASSAASAQVYGDGCRGETISELARCAAERAPAPPDTPAPEVGSVPGAGGVAPLSPQRLQPSRLGGALQPTNQRRSPPLVGRPTVPPATANVMPTDPSGFDPLGSVTDDPSSPIYELGRGDERLRIFDPLAGTRLRDAGEGR